MISEDFSPIICAQIILLFVFSAMSFEDRKILREG